MLKLRISVHHRYHAGASNPVAPWAMLEELSWLTLTTADELQQRVPPKSPKVLRKLLPSRWPAFKAVLGRAARGLDEPVTERKGKPQSPRTHTQIVVMNIQHM